MPTATSLCRTCNGSESTVQRRTSSRLSTTTGSFLLLPSNPQGSLVRDPRTQSWLIASTYAGVIHGDPRGLLGGPSLSQVRPLSGHLHLRHRQPSSTHNRQQTSGVVGLRFVMGLGEMNPSLPLRPFSGLPDSVFESPFLHVDSLDGARWRGSSHLATSSPASSELPWL